MKRIFIDMDEDQIDYDELAECQQLYTYYEDLYDDYPDFDIEYTTDYY